MAYKQILRAAIALAVAAGVALLFTGPPARADDYIDLLDLLRAKGTISQSEYQTLMSKHQRTTRAPVARRAQAQPDKDAPAAAAPAANAAEESKHAAEKAAAAAAASAAAAQAAMQQAQAMMDSPELVRAKPYTPGKGVTISVGTVDLNFSGFINGFIHSPPRSVGLTPRSWAARPKRAASMSPPCETVCCPRASCSRPRPPRTGSI
jgi:hypothetical protein